MNRECSYCHLPLPTSVRVRAPELDRVYCCFGCRLAAEITSGHGDEGHATWMLARLGAAIVLTMGVTMFTMPLYGFDVYAEDGAFPADGVLSHLPGVLRYASLFATSLVLMLLGVPLLTNALEQLRQGVITSDLLIVIGVAAAVAYSSVSTFADSGQVYFETACVILVLVTLGRYLEATGKNRASATLRALENLLPDTVDVQRGPAVESIPRSALRIGDHFLVKAGGRIPADGCLIRGEAHLDESVVTGESTPVRVNPGDAVRAGALNLDGHLLIDVTAVGNKSTLGRLMDAVAAARRQKTHFERLADRAVQWFLPVVLLIAVVAGGVAHLRIGLDAAIMTGLAVVLISCPCALGIATPLAAWVAVDQAARRGIVFRSATALEALATVRAVAFDKTGTLTDSAPTVAEFQKIGANGHSREALIALSGALAAASTHSVSRGVAEYARESGVAMAHIDAVKSVAGRGISAKWNGSDVCLGSEVFVANGATRAREVKSDGHINTWLGMDGRCVGVFRLIERLRPEAPAAIGQLLKLGRHVRVLTGDTPARANQIAAELGVPAVAALLPEDKLHELSAMRSEFGSVAMVGDGLNDTPALTLADVGLAMGCGADVTRDAADVCLLGNDLRGVPWAIELARRATRTMRTNLIWAAAYNVIGIPLAATGRLSPAFAALAMVVSSLMVVGNSLRLQKMPPGVDLP